MAEDANIEPGFYVLRDRSGNDAVGFAMPKEDWAPHPRQRWAILFTGNTPIGPKTSCACANETEIPSDRIIASIAELLRDAERYRWLRDRPIAPFECEYPGNWRFLSAEERNETVDAEIARDRHPGGGG